MAKSKTFVSKAKSSSAKSLSDFTRTQWEKTACVMPAPPTLKRVDAATVFILLTRYCDLAREKDSMAGLKFYVNGVRLESFEALEHLPVSEDKTFEGYHKRMSRGFRDYGLVCDELYSVMTDEFQWAREAIQEYTNALFEKVGLPNRFAELGLYLGNYKKTPFGVHVDRCGVLSLPVVGKKNFRIWKADVVEAHPELKESFSYDEFNERSSRLKVSPGEMAYWPSADWHIAESDGSFSVTWSIGVWVDKPVTEVAIEALQPLLETSLKKKLGRSRNATAMKSSKKLPNELEDAATAFSKLSKKEIHAALAAWWRTHVKSNGFK